MFQKITHSLVGRTLFFSILGTLVSSLIIIYVVIWLFEKSLDSQIDSHITTYVDLIASAIDIQNGKVSIDSQNPILKNLPRQWQIDTIEKHIARSPLLKDPIPIQKPISFTPRRLTEKHPLSDQLVVIQQAFGFSDGQVIIISFGLENYIINDFKSLIQNQFNRRAFEALTLVIAILIIISIVQSIIISRPLKMIKTALTKIRTGKEERINVKLPSEIQLLSDEINLLLDSTDNIIERYRVFSSNLSHSLKTPLTIIQNQTESPLIKEQTQTMLQIIERNLSKVKTVGTAHINRAHPNIYSVMTRMTESYSKIYSKEITIDVQKDIIFNGDEADLYEILGNIIENAYKFSKHHIHIILNDDIIIEDDGPGIPQENIQEVLSRGVRIDETIPGTGIGLSIAKDIIELYNGSLTLSHSALGGLKVIIHIPTSTL